MSEHKLWLDNEYSEWIKALSESTVHNFKEKAAVKRMLSLDLEGDWFDVIDIPDHLWNKLFKIHLIGTGVNGALFSVIYMFRMIYYAQEVLRRNPKSICEIGGGVGQFYAILRALGYEGSYCIMDLTAVQEFQIKYLTEVKRQTGLRCHLTRNSPEMVVSFYALGEFDDMTKESYSDFINSVGSGYIAWNPHSQASDDLSMFTNNIKVEPGIEPGVKIITW